MVKAGSFYRIPLSDAIFEAKKYLQIEDTSDDDFLEILAWNAVRFIMPLSNVVSQVKELEVCNGEVELPKNVLRFLWLRICEEKQESEHEQLSPTIPQIRPRFFYYADIQFMNECGCDSDESRVGSYLGVFKVNGNKLVFNKRGSVFFNKVQVAFVGYQVDEAGVFTVTDEVKQAVVYRICSEYSTVHSNKYDNYQKQKWAAQAVSLTNKVKGDDFYEAFRNNIDQIQGISKNWNYPMMVSRQRSRY